MRPWSLVGVLSVGAFAVLVDTSPLLAQNTVINACANISTGAVRVVFDGSTCKANEAPISWNVAGQPGPQGPSGPAGPPGPQNLVAISVDGTSTTKTAVIPDLGTVRVECDATGVATVTLTSPDPFEFLIQALGAPGFAEGIDTQVVIDNNSPLISVMLVNKLGVGTWKLDSTRDSSPPPGLHCVASAIVTITD
jgi:hypothetical protein